MQMSSPARKTHCTGKRVLVVERSRTIQTLLSIYLHGSGHQVLACSTPQEALKILADLHEAPDCLFLAIHGPEQDDYQLIHHVQAQPAYQNVSLIALVLQEDLALVQRRLKDIQVSYLSKPFRVQDALALVSAPIVGNGTPS